MVEAIRDAMDVSLQRDDNVVVFGEDVGYFGGVFRCTQGLQQKFGASRVFDTPISELGIVGAAVGMAAYGLRPCVEIQFADYMYPAYDQIVSEAARLRYRSNGQFTAPLVVRMPTGGGIFGGQTHSQSPEALFTHVSGLKTVVPSNPYDAKGLLIASIECDDPVIFFEPKRRYWEKAELDVEAGPPAESLHTARVVREGTDLTLAAYGPMVKVCLDSAVAAEEDGRSLEVLDLRSLSPLDTPTLFHSVRRTGRLVVVHEAPVNLGMGAEIAAKVQEACFHSLEAPILRVGGFDTPYPPSRIEEDYLPDLDRVLDTVDRSLSY